MIYSPRLLFPLNSLDGYTVGNSGCKHYKLVSAPALNQHGANEACKVDGALLAMSKTDEDAEDMNQLQGQCMYCSR